MNIGISNSSVDTNINNSQRFSKFGKCTASFGDFDAPYEAAIASHDLHNKIHGYPHFILREHMVHGLWSKHGWLITVIGSELAKPEDQRLEWLMWHDRDTVLMNPQIPLNIFVPPEPEFSNIQMLVTDDLNGLNNGVFMVRPWWASSVAYVPQHWFNGFPPELDINEDNKIVHAREGSLLIHFASNGDGLRPERMAHWDEVAKNRTAEWDKPVEETWYTEEIEEFWQRVGKGESYEEINKDIGARSWNYPKMDIIE
ncbi:hypothetical protein N0V90_010758 [Kalmusia sp. IMI 367209]|nr:hypothetical protein N0V90_010758 [Kalmusia sp. IMI 367209]